ncbi:MAG: ABC transporter permease [Clostridia bacterium]
MFQYTVRKVLNAIPILIGVSILVFLLVHLTPGDPARLLAGPEAYEEDIELIRERLGLNDPLHIQYYRFISSAVRLDFGRSFRTNRAVMQDIGSRFPNTVQLAFVSVVWAVIFGVAIGVYAGVRPNSMGDSISMGGAIIGVSAPSFWRGLLAMLLFAYWLRWLPASGMNGPVYTVEGLRTMIMPALTLGTSTAAILARMTRSNMLEVLGEDYIRTARAKGLAERVVVYKHALRNALIPVVTLIGLSIGTLLGGAVITEQVFAWPGIGTLLINGINARDYPMVQACILLIATVFVIVNLVVDLTYSVIDPRIRYN